MMRHLAFFIAELTSVLMSHSVAASQTGQLTIQSGVDFSSGDYGLANSTDVLYAPVSLNFASGAWRFRLTVPYLQITGPGKVLRDIGTAGGNTANTQIRRSGLGDVVAGASYRLYSNGQLGSLIDLTGKVKFGTADYASGLGTGQNDYVGQLDLYQSIGRVLLSASVGYRDYTSPAAYHLSNVFFAAVGAAYRITPGTIAGVSYFVRQRVFPTAAPREELTAYLGHSFTRNWRAQLDVRKGFTHSTPDWSAGFMVSYSIRIR